MVVGGFLWFPLAHKFGRSSAVFWSLVGLMAAEVWSATMTHRGEYWSFLGSRFLPGVFDNVAGNLVPRVLVDLFFLYQRGRAFTVFHFFMDLGNIGGPTLGAFVASGKSWTAAYWYAFALAAFAALMCFFFLHETAWDRAPRAENSHVAPEGFVANRVATLFPGIKVNLQNGGFVSRPRRIIKNASSDQK
jgi:MFS family permease